MHPDSKIKTQQYDKIHRLRNESGEEIFIRGYLTGGIIPQNSPTVYTRFGDVFI